MKQLFYKDMAWGTVINLFRVKDTPRWNANLLCPPQVNPMRVRPIDVAGTTTTAMHKYGWEEYLRVLNFKFDVAVATGLAMFNKRLDVPDDEVPFSDRSSMESLLFGRNWRLAIPWSYGWYRIITLNYLAGPPLDMPTYKQNPITVQKMTMVCRKGGVLARHLYYPVVCHIDVFFPSDLLEPWSENMETFPPPFGSELIGNTLEMIASKDRRYHDYRDWM